MVIGLMLPCHVTGLLTMRLPMVFEVDLGWWLTGDMALPDSHELSDHTHPFTLDILMTLTKSSHIVIPMLMMSRVVWWLKC